jgi:TPR repeat protein
MNNGMFLMSVKSPLSVPRIYARLLNEGVGLSINQAFGVYYLKLAADQGEVERKFLFVLALLKGEGGSSILDLAVAYLRCSADSGFEFAQFFYAHLFLQGRAIIKDTRIASSYLK